MKVPLIIPVLMLTSGCDFLRPRPPSPESRAAEFVECFRKEFSPSDEQLAVLKDKILVASEQDRQAANQLRTVTEELDRDLESEATEEKLMSGYKEVSRLKGVLSEGHFRKMLALRATLSPEQRKKFLACKRRLGPSELPHEG